MRTSRVAIRYSKALMSMAKEASKVDAIYADMAFISKTIQDSKDLELTLKSPIIKSDKKSAILNQVFSSNVSEISSKFIALVVDRNREDMIGEIANAFIMQYKKEMNIISAEVTSAIKLDEELRAKVLKIVKGEGTSEVELKEKVDPSIIGGFIIRVDDKQVDASIARKFADLKKNLS